MKKYLTKVIILNLNTSIQLNYKKILSENLPIKNISNKNSSKLDFYKLKKKIFNLTGIKLISIKGIGLYLLS